MIILFSRESDDTTIEIIKWLISQKKQFVRINRLEDFLFNISYEINSNNVEFRIRDKYSFNNIENNSFYFLGASSSISFDQLSSITDIQLKMGIYKYLSQESDTLMNMVFSNSTNQNSLIFGLSPFSDNKVNKLKTLEIANRLGLNIPLSAVVTRKKDLVLLKNNWGRIINKGLDAGININTSQLIINGQQTIEITDELLDSIDDNFYPSLIQQLVEKKFEIRIFIFQDLLYATAIFTQANKKSQIDGRQIDINRLNRHVPFIIPTVIESKLRLLLNELKLNYGSIDMILDHDDNFVLLEINPYGQFGYISNYGNYYIEQEIAKKL